MFLVGMLSPWSINAGIAGSKDAEEEEEAAGKGEGVDDGGVYGVCLYLFSWALSANVQKKA